MPQRSVCGRCHPSRCSRAVRRLRAKASSRCWTPRSTAASALTGSPAVAAVDRAIRRALAKRPADRPLSADVMADELRKYAWWMATTGWRSRAR